MQYAPTFNRVQIQPIDTEQVGSIVLAGDRSLYGKAVVVAAGPMAGRIEGTIHHRFKKGDHVVYLRQAAAEIPYGDKKVTIIDHDKILAKTGD